MNLYNETGTIALHLKVGLSGWVLWDTFTDHWTHNHLDTTTVPFPPHPSVFTCSVQVTEASYTLLVNGVSFVTYNHVVSELWTINALTFGDSIELLEVDMQL
ncbi:uncharacterized protein LOC124114991 [Haliotis rufescens]|uniref:uncharacterized protein LOC124114991 n=1 Tax=Haliotis rufescens TaxID=6454 RepID=UPI00201EEF4B|nr:uncharacterized protein LOC124114991 [Haliotis rufescens]